VLSAVAVEKLLPAKFAKIKSRQDALHTTFSVFLDIFYLPNFWDFEEKGVFQQPRDVTPTVKQDSRHNTCTNFSEDVGSWRELE
jgi:hypothetical protein